MALPDDSALRRRLPTIRNAVIVWVVANLVFQVLAAAMSSQGGAFFEHLTEHATTAAATYTFAVLSTTAVVAAVVAIFWARTTGHILTGVVGALLVVAGLGSTVAALPMVLTLAMLIFGVLGVVLAWRSWQGGRAAWAFSIALDGVLAVVLLFGAPKVRGLLHIDIWLALVPTALSVAATSALATLASDYDGDQAAAAAPAK